MAQLDPSWRHTEASKSQGTESSPNIEAPKSQTSLTFQQLVQGEASVWSPASSPKLRKNNDHEEDHHNRKSVLMKVKERARKLRHSLSGKKQQNDHHLSSDNSTPSWGVRLEDYEEEEEDPEYLGAPMYESELAPENYKETARQHPREVHGMPSEKHVIKKEEEDPEYLGAPMYESEMAPENYKETARQHPREFHGMPSEKHVIKKEEEDPEYLGAPMYESGVAPENYKESARQHPGEVHGMPSENHVNEEEQYYSTKQGNEEHSNPKKSITETVSERLGPIYAAMSEKLAPACGALSDATQDTLI